MTTITKEGDKLAEALMPLLGLTEDIRRTCSAISRNAKTYARIQMEWTNGPSDFIKADKARWDRWEHDNLMSEQRAEERLQDLMVQLPLTDNGPLAIQLGGDPRGYTVKIVAPDSDDNRKISNDWGLDGLGVA